MKLVIFSDMDGTLLDSKYSFKDAEESLELIRKKKIPLVLSSSKTRAELELYRKKMKNKHPFIVENGGAIFIPKNYFSKRFKHIAIDNYKIIEIGTYYPQLRRALNTLKEKFPEIKGFGDMSLKELADDCGLTLEEAELAKKREYDEAFKMKKENWCKAKKIIRDLRFYYTEGGRYYHILGKNDKGKAVKMLTELYKKQFDDIKTVALGDSPNDFPMFENTDSHLRVKGPKDWNKKVLKLLT